MMCRSYERESLIMSRRSMWSTRAEVPDSDGDLRSALPQQSNDKPKKMPVRVGPGYTNGMANKSGPQYFSCILSPVPQSVSRQPMKVVRTPKGGKLVRSEAKPVAAGGSKSVRSKVIAAQDVNKQQQVPTSRTRALKQLDFNKQTMPTPPGQANKKGIDSAKKVAASSNKPQVKKKSVETDLRQFALAQSASRKQNKLDLSIGARKLSFSPDVEEATEISKMRDISDYVAYQSTFVNNSDLKRTSDEEDSLTSVKKMRVADRIDVQQATFAGKLPCTVTSEVAANMRFPPAANSQVLDLKLSQAPSNVRFPAEANTDKVLDLLLQLHAHNKQQADMAQKQANVAQKQADLAQKQANVAKEQADLAQTQADLARKCQQIMDQFLNSSACTSVNTSVNVPEANVQNTSNPVSVLKLEPVTEPPTTPSRRRSSRLARLSGINDRVTEGHVPSPVHNTLLKEAVVTVLVSQPPEQSPGVIKCEAGQSSAAPLATDTSNLDVTLPSPKKVPAMPRRSIVNYEILRASFPGLMKTPRKTPIKSSKKLSQVYETPDISRRVQASLQTLFDDA